MRQLKCDACGKLEAAHAMQRDQGSLAQWCSACFGGHESPSRAVSADDMYYTVAGEAIGREWLPLASIRRLLTSSLRVGNLMGRDYRRIYRLMARDWRGLGPYTGGI